MLKLPAGTDSMLWIINHMLLLSEPHSFTSINVWTKQACFMPFPCVSGSIYLPHMFCLFPSLGYRFSYLSFSFRHPLGPHSALEIAFHYCKPCFLLEESFPLSLSFLKNYFIFPFFSFHLPSQLWFIFILCVFNYKLPPMVLFLWSLYHCPLSLHNLFFISTVNWLIELARYLW